MLIENWSDASSGCEEILAQEKVRNLLAARSQIRKVSCMDERFVVFSPTHMITMIVGFAFLLILMIASRRSPVVALPITRAELAFFCLTAYGYSQYAWSTCQHSLQLDQTLPFHLCDVAGFLAGYALLSRKPWAQELTYYWGLAATIQALVTPALSYTFPHLTFFSFFLHHFAIVGAALFIPLCDAWRPSQPWWSSPWRAFLSVNVYMMVAGVINFKLGTNFGFLARPPDTPSLIDHLGPWPYYILAFEVIALLLFFILTMPLLRKNCSTSRIAS